MIRMMQFFLMYALKIFSGLKQLSTIFDLCNPLTSMDDFHHLMGWIRNSFTYLAMMDYPYPTSFMGNLPGNPVKVRLLGTFS